MPHHAETRTNHYKFWKLQQSRRVHLEVEGKGWDAEIGCCVEFIGNPTMKRVNGVETSEVDERLHLLAYRLTQAYPPPRPSVTLVNQFGGPMDWELGPAELLLVPAAKQLAPNRPDNPPQTATHYVCYRALFGPPVYRPIVLRDQFDRQREREENVGRLQPAFLALPARKNQEEMGDAGSLLAIYEIDPRETAEPPLVVNTLDQFGPRQLTADESWFLAVPCWRPEDQ